MKWRGLMSKIEIMKKIRLALGVSVGVTIGRLLSDYRSRPSEALIEAADYLGIDISNAIFNWQNIARATIITFVASFVGGFAILLIIDIIKKRLDKEDNKK